MSIYWPYAAPLFVIAIASLFGNGQMIRTAIAITANWSLGTAFVYATGIYDPWAFSLALDALTAFIVLYHPAGRVQSAIGWTYIAQIIIHCVYAVSNHAIAQHAYWQLLTWIAFLQLALLGGWIVGHWGRRYFSDSRDPLQARAHGSKGVAP